MVFEYEGDTMEKKEEMLEELRNVVLRRMKTAGIETDPGLSAIILTDLKSEWEVYGYDSARIRAERTDLTVWAQ